MCGLAGMTPTVMAFQGSGPRPMCCSAVLIMPVACFTCPAAAVLTAGILPGAASAAVTSTCGGRRCKGIQMERRRDTAIVTHTQFSMHVPTVAQHLS